MYTNDGEIRVRYKETDQMGAVYYANYLVWFEVGRVEFMRSLGLSYKELEQAGILLPVIESHCYYKQSAKYDDLLAVRTGIEKMSGARISFVYHIIRKEDEVLLAEGRTLHAFADVKTLRPLNLKKHYTKYYESFLKCL